MLPGSRLVLVAVALACLLGWNFYLSTSFTENFCSTRCSLWLNLTCRHLLFGSYNFLNVLKMYTNFRFVNTKPIFSHRTTLKAKAFKWDVCFLVFYAVLTTHLLCSFTFIILQAFNFLVFTLLRF